MTQSRLDALADAETLRRFDPQDIRLETMARSRAFALDRDLIERWPAIAHGNAFALARAAFRAVPGLRGDS